MIDLGPIPSENIAYQRTDDGPFTRDGLPPWSDTPAHALSDWSDICSRPLCEVAGRLERIENAWYALTPAGVRCQDCLEWMHA